MLKNILSVQNSYDPAYKLVTILWKKFYIRRYLLILKIKKSFPKTMNIPETIDYILDNKCSISRFGDGEYSILTGHGIRNYQEFDETLTKRLREIICNPTKNCLIGIVPPKNLNKFWTRHFITNYKHYQKYLNKNK